MSTTAPVQRAPLEKPPGLPPGAPERANFQGHEVDLYTNTEKGLQSVREFCYGEEKRTSNLVNSVINIIAVISAIAISFFGSIAIGPFAGIVMGVAALFLVDGLLTAIATKTRSWKYENAASATYTPDFLKYAENKKLALSRENILNIHKDYRDHQAYLRNAAIVAPSA